jgi:hypothetical protein
MPGTGSIAMLRVIVDCGGGQRMTLMLDDKTRTHLDRVRTSITREFDHIPQHEVNARFDQIVAQLLSDATFVDFVPVLAWRYSRETLRTMEGLPAEYRPS